MGQDLVNREVTDDEQGPLFHKLQFKFKKKHEKKHLNKIKTDYHLF